MALREEIWPWDSPPGSGDALRLADDVPGRHSIVCALPLNGRPEDLATGRVLTLGAGGSYAAGERGLSLRGFGSAAVASLPLNLSAFTGVSVSCWFYWNSYANDDDLLFEFTPNTNSNQGFLVDPNSASTVFDVVVSTGNTSAPGVAQARISRPSAAVWHHLAFYGEHNNAGTVAATVQAVWVDGVQVTVTGGAYTGGAGTNAFANSTLYLLSRNNASLFGAGRLANLVIRGGYRLTDADVLAEYQRPWGLYEQRHIWVPVSAGGGGDATASGTTSTATASLAAGSASGESNATASGATVAATSSLISGAASGEISATASGQALAAASSLIPGAASGASAGTASGVTLTAASTLIAGAASGQINASAAGQTLAATASLIAGSASGASAGTAPGATVSATASLTAGSAAGQINATGAGVTITAAAGLIAGSASAANDSTASGTTLTGTASLQPGTATGQRNATAAGATLAAAAALIAGAASASGSSTLFRPTSDVSATGWTATPPGDLFDAIDETAANDADFISTIIAGASPAVFGIGPLSAGSYTIRIRAATTNGSGTLRAKLQDAGGTTIATTPDQAIGTTPTTYELAASFASGTATRIALEVAA